MRTFAEFLSSDERMGSFLGAMAEELLTSSEVTRMLRASKATITRSVRLGELLIRDLLEA